MKKHHLISRKLAIWLLAFIQLIFLFAILHENTKSIRVTLLMLGISFLVLFSYWRAPIHSKKQEYESVAVAVWVPIGAVCCFFIHHIAQLGPVLGASITGLAASFIPAVHKKSIYLKKIPAAIYCGAFVGMSSSRIAYGLEFVLIAGCLAALVMIVSKSLLDGIGGKLGSIAFLGVAITYLLVYLFQ